MKIKYKLLKKIMIVILVIFSYLGIFSTELNATYKSDYRYWNQKDTQDSIDSYRMGKYGCWVTAQAKLLYAMGIETNSDFNPDVYLDWERKNGCIDGDFNQTYKGGWNGPIKYAESKGKVLAYQDCSITEGDIQNGITDIKQKIKLNAEKGNFYMIIHLAGGTRGNHYILVDNEYTIANGEVYVDESGSEHSIGSGKENGPIPLKNLEDEMYVSECYVYYVPLILTANVNPNGKSKLSWNEIPGATKYVIARKRWKMLDN